MHVEYNHHAEIFSDDEIVETQVFYYPVIFKTIDETGFYRCMAQETKKGNKLESLREGVLICYV